MRIKLLAFVSLAAAFAIPTAFATLGTGVGGVVQARGTSDSKVRIKELKNTDFVTQQLTIAPGGHTGWHSHPGSVLVVVKAGTFEYAAMSGRGGDDDDDDDDDGRGGRCFSRTYTAGQSFVDPGGRTHIGRNVGTTPVELWATYTGVPVGGAFRIDENDQGC